MSTTDQPITEAPTVTDRNLHIYEVEPRFRSGTGTAHMIEASQGKRMEAAKQSAIAFAQGLLAEHPEFEAFGLYHTYPGNGPVRRFVCEVKRPK